MLARRRLGAIALVTGTLLAASVHIAWAAPSDVTCPPTQPVCVIVVTDPGTPGSGGSGGGSPTDPPVCHDQATGAVVPCYDPNWGWWSSTDSCYYMKITPAPLATDPAWQGHYPDGAIYQATCPSAGGTGGGWRWFPNPPAGYGGAAPSAATLAQSALRQLLLTGPEIGMAPGPGKTGLVGLPVWLWTTVSPSTWGPTSATAAVPGLSVTATAWAQKIVWDMGDGHSVTCTNPGTAYTTSKGAAASPTCGYRYAHSSASQPGSVYTVTATTTWSVTWAGGGQSGVLTVTRTSTTSVRIGELQVLVS